MGRNTTLTEELGQKLEFYWQLAGDTLSDEQICHRVGISYGQLKGWLRRDVKPRKPDGTLGPEGLRSLRARAKVSTLTTYLSKLNRIAERAEAAGDFRTAMASWQWLLARQFPKQYGDRARQEDQQAASETGVAEVPSPAAEEEQWSQETQRQCQTAHESSAEPGPPPAK